ncbi:hypothetical protein [Streptomyces sp. NPDC002952]|uniref:hypothetical protein n=1 Tax=Streptomyces sp. NPDC002952 TaxID=3364673 RepID=UPI0036A05804
MRKLLSLILATTAAVGGVSDIAHAQSGMAAAPTTSCSPWVKVYGPSQVPLWQYSCISRSGNSYYGSTRIKNNAPIGNWTYRSIRVYNLKVKTSVKDTPANCGAAALAPQQEMSCSTPWETQSLNYTNAAFGFVDYTDPSSNIYWNGTFVASPWI